MGGAECLVSSEEKVGGVKVEYICEDEAFCEFCLLYIALFVASLLRAEKFSHSYVDVKVCRLGNLRGGRWRID
jgi:hypothetical protein